MLTQPREDPHKVGKQHALCNCFLDVSSLNSAVPLHRFFLSYFYRIFP
ncbi:hypothetical protein SXCC_02474 [Gluconacetobacter sp. SXCC-1]|nr:hypothetical protein SXCC_02474 [Gluconacetobacter sp. SXCC-1]